ncbi:hypothetical protein MK476_04265 [Streptococcus oralis]|uniref:hypothetical protein n=2 Tax=Streptococcus oralis TaxID=1303 RepID=UPI0022840D9B|nr:hypothetical protein [Streptococcus oralis]MCY7093618.1 hypothetical protein [Streptococcus oralis]
MALITTQMIAKLKENHTRKEEVNRLLFWFRKAVKASVKELKDQNKNEKYLDNEGKIVLQ